MSFEAVVASAGGNDTVLAKSFVITAEGDIGMVLNIEAKFNIFMGRPLR